MVSLNGGRMNVSVPHFKDWKARTQTFEDLAAYREADGSLAIANEPGWIDFAWVYGDFFRLWGRSPLLGRVQRGYQSGASLGTTRLMQRYGLGIELPTSGVAAKGAVAGDTGSWRQPAGGRTQCGNESCFQRTRCI